MSRRAFFATCLGLPAAAKDEPDLDTFYRRIQAHEKAWVAFLQNLCGWSGDAFGEKCRPGAPDAGLFNRAGETAAKLWGLRKEK